MAKSLTFTTVAAGAINPIEALGYIGSQLAGGVAGALLPRTVLGGVATGLGVPALAHNLTLAGASLTITPIAGFIIEAVLAFFLVTGGSRGSKSASDAASATVQNRIRYASISRQ